MQSCFCFRIVHDHIIICGCLSYCFYILILKFQFQKVLIRLASIDLSELRNEAKVECCRATRDLRSCGRDVQYVLSSCGHASLCAECSQRCDICPICRIPIAKNKNNLQLRLYYECIEAGLISSRGSERFEEVEDGENQLTADVQRLYSFFDIAMENNLVSLVCHCILLLCLLFFQILISHFSGWWF